jgi:hypothetical protein
VIKYNKVAYSSKNNKTIRNPLSQEDLRERALQWLEPFRVPQKFRIIRDTSDFFRVDYDDVVILNNHPYLIRHNQKEGRFGIDEEPKFWVKGAIDLIDGSRKIIKLVFYERFKARVGHLVFDCVRSPVKEARVIDIVSRHPNFMTGFSVKDSAGNVVRILDYIYGKTMADYAAYEGKNHEEYFWTEFHDIFKEFIEAVKAVKFLHENNEVHGDTRRDHLLKDKTTGRFRWIDFDFTYGHHENRFGYDIFGLGNILAYITGGGDITVQQLKKEKPDIFSRLSEDDMNIIFHNRVVNLKKVFSHIPESLNNILLHFSMGAEVFYDDTGQLLDDMMKAEDSLHKA